jgi:uncharacterized protein
VKRAEQEEEIMVFANRAPIVLIVLSCVTLFFQAANAQNEPLVAAASEQSGALLTTAYDGDVVQVKALLAAGADVNARNVDRASADAEAPPSGRRTLMMDLVPPWDDSKKSVKDGGTPLMAASQSGHAEVVRALLAAGADVNAKKDYGLTALMLASVKNHSDVVRLLLAAGADPNAGTELSTTGVLNARTGMGTTALMLASDTQSRSWEGSHSERGYLEVVQALIAGGADVNARTGDDRSTALLAAAQSKNPDIVRALLGAKADVNAQESNGNSALMLATGNQDIVRALLVAGADVNARKEDGTTALMWAAASGSPEDVRILLAAGADVNARDKSGWSATKHAAQFHRLDNIDVLKAAGAKE